MRMRNATKEERASVDNYIKSISEPIYSFTQEELKEHDAKVRADAIDEAIKYFEEHAKEIYNHISARDFICDRLEYLKEQK